LTVTAPANQTSVEGATISGVTVKGSTTGGQTLTYAAFGLPPGLSINESTGVISGTIGYTYDVIASPYKVTVSVSDGTELASANFVWTVKSEFLISD